MSDPSRFESHSTGSDAGKTSQNPLDEASDVGSAARGQSSELGNALVQRKGGGPAKGDLNAVVGSVGKDGGGPIPHKAEMESAFGTSFDGVKATTGAASAKANDALGAKAFTAGDTVAFGSPSPSKELVAHELTHVVQQRAGGGAGVQQKTTLGQSGDRFEQEADKTASTVAAGGKVDASALSAAPSGLVSREETPLPKKFDKLWAAHPHNYQADDSQNTSSDDVNNAAGFDPAAYQNTCAIRMSVMWNKLGGEYKITKAKGAQAGLAPGRIVYSKKQDWYYILSAKEMWTYVSHHFGKPHKTFPNGKRFKSADEFNLAFEKDIKPYITSRSGIVAFDKIFGYGGSGHVDIFNGETLSDSSSWYASQQIKLWIVPT